MSNPFFSYSVSFRSVSFRFVASSALIWLWALLFPGILLAGPSSPEAATEGLEKPSTERYSRYEKKLLAAVQKYSLANGIRLITVRNDKGPTVSCYIRFKVGSVDENYNTTGTAHLLEHMLFKGTDRIGSKDWQQEKKLRQKISRLGRARDYARRHGYSEDVIRSFSRQMKRLRKKARQFTIKDPYDAIYSRHGAKGFNASTSVDVTTYKVSLPKNRLRLWAYVESERLRNPILREFYSERDVVLEERRMRVESKGSGLLYESFLSTAFRAHPYGHPIVGWESTLSYLSQKEAKRFFLNYYQINNMVITVVGDIQGDEVHKIVQKYFGRLPEGPSHPPRTSVREPKQRGERRVVVEHQDRPELIIGFHKPSMPAREDYVFDMLGSLLSEGRTSRLKKELVYDKKLATDVNVYASIPGSRYDNLFTIIVTPQKGVAQSRLEKAIYAVLDKLKKHKVSSRELQKVKNRMEFRFLLDLESDSSLASTLSYFEIMAGDWKYLLNYRSVISSITAEEIRQVAQRFLVKSNRTVAYLKQVKE